MPRILLLAIVIATTVMAQSGPVGTEPSPFEAFATKPGSNTVWSGNAGRLESGATEAIVTPMEVENGAERMSGIVIDLSTGGAKDRIYLDEEATQRTITAMNEIVQGAARMGVRANGCEGAKEFWPLYNWPWNKYHELNVDFCGGNQLILYPRGKDVRFSFSGKDPTNLSGILTTALTQLKQH